MSDFMTPPGHVNFNAKMLATDLKATLLDVAVAYIEPGGGGPSPAHTHANNHLFVVVEGCATIKMGNQLIAVQTDETVYVKGDMEHSIWNESDKPLKVLKINCR